MDPIGKFVPQLHPSKPGFCDRDWHAAAVPLKNDSPKMVGAYQPSSLAITGVPFYVGKTKSSLLLQDGTPIHSRGAIREKNKKEQKRKRNLKKKERKEVYFSFHSKKGCQVFRPRSCLVKVGNWHNITSPRSVGR